MKTNDECREKHKQNKNKYWNNKENNKRSLQRLKQLITNDSLPITVKTNNHEYISETYNHEQLEEGIDELAYAMRHELEKLK